jgi:DNA-binding TFAR19-related protein (PDSD5 family)
MSTELELLRQKRAAELRRKMLESKNKPATSQLIPAKPTPREIVRRSLVGRGIEVLETARRQYPSEIAVLEENLAKLIEQGRLKGPISGEELYTFLQRAGLQFSMNTKIRIAEGGELKSIEEKLRGQSEHD